jgi:hypothetical protein
MNLSSIRQLATTLFATAFVMACGGGSEFEPRDLSFSPVEGSFYGDWPVQSYVVRTRPEWIAVWSQHDSLQFPPPQMPEVDFLGYTIVGISLGWGPSGCHGLRIAKVREEQLQVRVFYQRVIPDAGAICTASEVPLVAFVKIPATAKEVLFAQSDG